MLSSPNKYSPDYIEGIVLYVDSEKYICSVKTVDGKILQDVTWLLPTGGNSETGMHVTPNIQDMVVISTSLGYPLILGTKPRLGKPAPESASITGAAPTISLKATTSIKGVVVGNPCKPLDMVPGDFAYTTKGGGLIAALLSGIVVLRSSPLSQIIITKYEGLVRIVNRNYQRFSESSSYAAVSIKGRVYDWFGADWSMLKNKASTERYNEVYGDVAAGEVLRGFPDPAVSLPAQDTRVVKKWLKDASGAEVMSEVLTQDGSIVVTVGGAKTTISPTGVKVEFGTSKGTFDSSQASIESNGHYCRVTSTGVSLG